jgi:hypothetical protein
MSRDSVGPHELQVRATDTDRWLQGMNKLQRRLEEKE